MDTDFHFYGTYYAARTAGFDHAEAKTIAGAAQFIDDNNEDTSNNTEQLVVEVDINTDKPYPMGTIMSGMDGPIYMGKQTYEHLRQLWPVYHFLPGNYQFTGKTPPGHEPRAMTSTRSSNKNEGVEERFRWLCRPNSFLAKAIIDNTQEFYQENYAKDGPLKQLSLHLVGVRMHVLADTFAHQDFVGDCDSRINDVSDAAFTIKGKWKNDIYWEPNGRTVKPVNWHDKLRIMDSSVWNRSPTSPKKTAASYLGHGRAGHLPDMAYLYWTYTPGWKNSQLVRNNPEQYIRAFITLVKAMQAIRSGGVFTPLAEQDYVNAAKAAPFSAILAKIQTALGYSGLPEDIMNLSPKWKTLRLRQCDHWVKTFGDTYPGLELSDDEGQREHDLVVAEWRKWAEEKRIKKHRFKKDEITKIPAEDALDSDYFLFMLAVKRHFKFVSAVLIDHGLRLQKEVSLDTNANTKLKLVDDLDMFKQFAFEEENWKRECRQAIDYCMRKVKTNLQQEGIRYLESGLFMTTEAMTAAVNKNEAELAYNYLKPLLDNEKKNESEYKLFANKEIKKKLLDLLASLEVEKSPRRPRSNAFSIHTRPRSNAITSMTRPRSNAVTSIDQ